MFLYIAVPSSPGVVIVSYVNQFAVVVNDIESLGRVHQSSQAFIQQSQKAQDLGQDMHSTSKHHIDSVQVVRLFE